MKFELHERKHKSSPTNSELTKMRQTPQKKRKKFRTSILGFAGFGRSDKRPETNAKKGWKERPTKHTTNLFPTNPEFTKMRQTPQKKQKKFRTSIHGFAGFGRSDKRPETNLKRDEIRDPRCRQNMSNASRDHENASDATEKMEEILNVHTRLRGFWTFRQIFRN